MADAGTPTFFSSSRDRFGDGLLLAGDPFDRQELHQMVFGGFHVQRNVALLMV